MGTKVGFGQEIHRFLSPEASKPCQVAGVTFEGVPGFQSESDGDLVYHALCHAITSVTTVPILGAIAKELCEKDGITDSAVYLREALKTLGDARIVHIAIILEGMRPRFEGRFPEMRANIARLVGVPETAVGMTAYTGQGLTDVGCGHGVRCCTVITVED